MFVTSRGFQIHYQVCGSGPDLVLLHGRSMWGDRWRDRGYVSALEGSFRLIIPDLLGHGHSDKPYEPECYRMPNMVTDVLAILDAQNVKRAHVWGYSMGTAVAECLAVRSPERVRSLILGGFPPGLDEDQRRALLPPGDVPRTWDEAFPGWPRPLMELFKAHNDLRALQAMFEWADKDPTTNTDLKSAGRPTLVYIGEDDQPFTDLARRQSAALGCAFRTVPGGHIEGFASSDLVVPLALAHIDALREESAADQ